MESSIEDPKADKLQPLQQEERKVEDEQQQQPQQTKDNQTPEASEVASSLEDDEVQENTQSSTVIEPPATQQDYIEEEDEPLEEDSMGRRVFKGPELLAREVKKLRNGKLFSKGNQSARKRRRKRKRLNRVPLLKSSTTRQGYTTTANYAGLDMSGEQLMNSLAANPISNSIKQHFPKVLSNPLQLSSAVQKLIMNKISPQANGQNYKYSPQQQRNPKSHYHRPVESGQQLFGYTTGYIENPPETPSHWSPSEDSPTYMSSAPPKHRHRHPVAGSGSGGKMIPIEIVGLDPAVASSILLGPNESPNNAASMQSDSSQLYNQAATTENKYQQPATTIISRPKSSSILHIHHFHHQAKQQVAGRPAPLPEPAQQLQAVNYQGQQQQVVEEQVDAPVASSGTGVSTNEAQQVQSGHQQAFLNAKGELVYLAVEDQNPAKQVSSESDKYQDVVTVGQHNAEPSSDGHHDVSEDTENYQPAGQNVTAELSPIVHRYRNQRPPQMAAHHVQLDQSAQGDSVSELGNDMTGEKLVMVSYKPANTSADETNSLKGGAYNEGQESNQVSAKHQLSVPQTQQLEGHQDDRVALFSLATQSVDHQNNEAGRAQRLASMMPNLLQMGNVSSNGNILLPHRDFNLVPSTLLSPLTSSALRAQNDILATSPWLIPTPPRLNGYSDKYFSKPNPLLAIHNQTFDQQQNFIEKLALLRHINQLNNSRHQPHQQQHIRQQTLRSPNNLSVNNSTKLTNQEFMLMLNEQLKQSNNNNNNSLSSNSFNVTALANLNPSQNLNSSGNRFELAQASDDSPPKFLKSIFSTGVNRINPVEHNQLQHQKVTSYQNHHTSGSQHKSIIPVDLQPPQTKRQPVNSDTEVFSLNDTSGISNIALGFICIISMVTLTIIAASMFYRHRRRNSGRCAELTLGKTGLTRRTKRFMRSSFESNDGTSIKSISLGGESSSSKSKLSGRDISTGEGSGNIGGNGASGGLNINHMTVGRRAGELHTANGQTTLSTFTGGGSCSPDKYQFADDPDIKTLNTRAQKPSYFKSLISSRQPDSLTCNKRHIAGCNINGAKTNDVNSCYLNLKQRPSKITSAKQLRSIGSIEDSSCKLSHSFKESSVGENAQSSANSTTRNPASNKTGSSEYLDSRHSFESKYNSNRMSTIHSVNSRISKQNAHLSSDQSKKPSINSGYGHHKRLTNLPTPKHVVPSLTANYNSHNEDIHNGHTSEQTQIDRL